MRVKTIVRRSNNRPFQPYLGKRELLLGEIRAFLGYLRSAELYRPTWRFVNPRGHYAALLFARILTLLGRRRRTYLLNFYLHGLGRNPLVRQVLRLLLTPEVHVFAQTRADAEYFRRFLPAANVPLVPYCQAESEHVSLADATRGEYVFAGGIANRDYETLLRCAERMPEVPFVVVASAKNAIARPTPENVTLLRDRPPEEFDRLVAGCRMTVIPLKRDVGSSGQMVLLKAMSLAKPVALPAVGAVTDYVTPGRTCVSYELGSDRSMAQAISSLYRDGPKLAEMGAAAREAYEREFTPDRYWRRIVDYIVEDSVG